MQTATPAVFQSEYLSALLSSIEESVVATDDKFIIRYWNKGAEQIFGYTAEATIGKRGSTVMKFNYLDETEEEARNMLINLLNNALKFSGENKKVKIKSTVAKNKIELNIKDEGIGMSKDDQRHLFESFYRGKNAQNIQGTGLGLHIVKRYVQLLNGEIKLESSLEEGTTVEVTLKNN